jgi:hypothetical protein
MYRQSVSLFCVLRRDLLPLCCLFFSLVRLLLWRSGKMGAPRGWYGEEERTKPVVLKRDRSKSNIISLHGPASLPVTGAATTHPNDTNNEPTQGV